MPEVAEQKRWFGCFFGHFASEVRSDDIDIGKTWRLRERERERGEKETSGGN
jgi:hypothetical protein